MYVCLCVCLSVSPVHFQNLSITLVLLLFIKVHKRDIEDLNTFDESLWVEKCGLFIDSHKGYLAASPDGTVGKDGLLKVKCPHVCRDNSIEDLERQDHSFCLEFDFMKRNHNYYYQVQEQLHIANR